MAGGTGRFSIRKGIQPGRGRHWLRVHSRSTCLFIRPQAPRDAAAIEAMQRRAYVEEFGQSDGLDPDIEANTRYLVGELGEGELIGCVGAVVPGAPSFYFERLVQFGDPRLPRAAHRHNTCEPDGLVIGPDYAGCGYGRLLLCAIALEVEAMGAEFSIGLCNDSARGMIDKTGGQLSGSRFQVGNASEELVFCSASAVADRARPWLGRALRAGKLRLAESLRWRLEPVREVG